MGKTQGHVEADETLVGGRETWDEVRRYGSNKTIIMGLKERGGRIQAEVIPDVTTATLRKAVRRTVERGTTISTDERRGYDLLTDDGYVHGVVNHDAGEHVRGEHHTNSLESFWKLFKYSVRSTHIQISKKYTPLYLGEFTFRSNYCRMTNAMFDLLIAGV